MADVGMSDVLSIMRENIASEREARLGEMQIALSALQYESERQFREEGRQREDALLAIQTAKEAATESMGKDADVIYSRVKNLDFIKRDSEGNVKDFKAGRKNKHLGGMSVEEAQNIYTMVSSYESDNAKQQQIGEEMAFNLGQKVSKQHEYWLGTGRDAKKQSSLLKGLSSLGALYSGVKANGQVLYDDVEESLSYDAFYGVSEALNALSNIEAEIAEIGTGEYGLQREIYAPREDISYDIPEESGLFDIDTVTSLVDAEIDDVSDAASASQSEYNKSYLEGKNLDKRRVELTNEKLRLDKLEGQGFQIDEEAYNNIIAEIDSVKKQSREAHRRTQYLYKQSRSEHKQSKIEELTQRIMEESGLDATEENLQVARSRATNILETPGGDQYGERAGYAPGTRPAYDIYGRIKK